MLFWALSPWCHGTVAASALGILQRRLQSGIPEISDPRSCSIRFNNRSLPQTFMNACQKQINYGLSYKCELRWELNSLVITVKVGSYYLWKFPRFVKKNICSGKFLIQFCESFKHPTILVQIWSRDSFIVSFFNMSMPCIGFCLFDFSSAFTSIFCQTMTLNTRSKDPIYYESAPLLLILPPL